MPDVRTGSEPTQARSALRLRLGLTGAIYGWVAVAATAWFALLAAQITFRTTGAEDRMRPEKRLFAYSIAYLFILFGAVVADRWLA